MARTMECLHVTEWGGSPEVTEAPVPSIGPTDVLIDVEAVSVGRTVANVINGDLGDDEAHLPRIPGHELVGHVVETGEAVSSLDEGELVTAYTYLACDHCEPCWRGLQPLCENLAGFLGVDMDGGYAEYARLPAANTIAIPDDLDPVDATVIPDALSTPYHVANQRANVDPGDEVLILGAGGGVGIHLVQVADHFGGRVTAADIVGEKLDRCAEVGAARTVDTSVESVADRAAEWGIEYDAIIDFTGAIDLIEEVTPLLAPRGRLVNLTTFPGDTFEVSPRRQVFGETELVGSRSFAKWEVQRAAKLLAEGVVEPVVTEVVDLDGVADLLDRIAADEVLGRGAVTV